jgi:aspartate/methionine/tyrosine aminotransferase
VVALSGLRAAAPVALERWFAAQGAPPAVDMARSGAPDLSTADVLRAAGDGALEAYAQLPLGYGDPVGDARLRAAIVAAGHARSIEEVIVTAGAAEALLIAVAASLGTGDRVAVGAPAYGGLVGAAEASGARVSLVPVWRPGSARLDLHALCAAVVEGGMSTAIVNSPHNPTGAVADPGELVCLAAECARRGGRLVVDEVAVSTLDDRAPSLTADAAFAEGTVVTVGDVSKSLGLGGLRIGWLASADVTLLERAAALKDMTTLGPPVPSQFLAALALEHRDAFRPAIAGMAQRNRDQLISWTERMTGCSCAAPADGLVAFPRLPMPSAVTAFVRRLRVTHGVAVTPGELFGSPQHIRVGLGLDPWLFGHGLAVLEDVLS